MSFNSLKFLVFFLIVLIVHWLIPSKFRWIWLLIASYYFYMSWNPWAGFLIFGTTLVSYLAGLWMDKARTSGMRKFILVLTIILCLSCVFVFKYLDFTIGNVIWFLNLFGLNLNDFSLNLILPVGISFFTFQALSYVIDVYKGKFQAEKHPGYFFLFISYFPQLVAGPIERPENLLPQLKADRKFSWQDMDIGLKIALIGYFRKVVVADFFGTFTTSVLSNIETATSLSVFVAGALFMFQIYCDFAGYSEIARGVSKMMGINLMQNFNSPFLATSITEFMRRWHISLMDWFKDYVYIPLGGNRKGKARKYLNILIVYALSGLWHGANWTYVLWALYVCVATILESMLRKPFFSLLDKCHIDRTSAGYVWIRRILLLLLVVPAGLMFRASSLSDIGRILSKLFSGISFTTEFFTNSMTNLSMTVLDVIETLLLFVLLYQIAMLYENNYLFFHFETKDANGALTLQGKKSYIMKTVIFYFAVVIIALGWLYLSLSNTASQFVYFQF